MNVRGKAGWVCACSFSRVPWRGWQAASPLPPGSGTAAQRRCQASSLGRGAELIAPISWTTPGCLRGQRGEELRRAAGLRWRFWLLSVSLEVRGAFVVLICDNEASSGLLLGPPEVTVL